LVGSYARGECTEESDIDLLVWATRYDDIRQSEVRSFFRSHLEGRGFHVQSIDAFVIDDRDLGPQTLRHVRASHMRFLEAGTGVFLWGEDFRGLLTPPPRRTVLERSLRHASQLLNDPRAIDERDVLLVAIGRMYAHTDRWPSKREATEWDEHLAVRLAWQHRTQGEPPVDDEGVYADYVRAVAHELATFIR
jgi:hypothetical protein